MLGGLLDDPNRPFVAVLGGAKVSDKLGVIDALLDKVDKLVVGGAMCFTFFAAQGHEWATRCVEPDQVDTCQAAARRAGDKHPAARRTSSRSGPTTTCARSGARRCPTGWKGLDIGPGTAAEFTDAIAEAPHRVLERPDGRVRGRALRRRHPRRRPGGGRLPRLHRRRRRRQSPPPSPSSVSTDDIDHVSTGGGASLEFIEQGDLPGLAALRKASNARGDSASRSSAATGRCTTTTSRRSSWCRSWSSA